MISKQLINPFQYHESDNNEVDNCCDNPSIDYSDGEIVCRNCGTVIGQSLVVQERNASDIKELQKRKQTEVPCKDCGYRTVIDTRMDGKRNELKNNLSLYNRLSKIQRSLTGSIERNIWEARPQIKQLCDSLNIPDYIRATAWKIYLRCAKHKLMMGRSILQFIGASVYVAIRIHKFPRLFDEVSDEVRKGLKYKLILQRSISMIIQQVLPELGWKYSNITPKELISYFCTKLLLPIQIQIDSNLLLQSAYKHGLRDDGKDPCGLAAAAIYMMSNKAITQEYLSIISKCTPVTLRNNIKRIKQYIVPVQPIKTDIKYRTRLTTSDDTINKLNNINQQQVIDMKKAGSTINDIINATQLTIHYINKILEEAGLIIHRHQADLNQVISITQEPEIKYNNDHYIDLPSEMKEKIVQMRNSGSTINDIVIATQVSFCNVHNILKGTNLL